MKYIKLFEELNLDMMNAHGIKDGKLEMNKEYLWIEKVTKNGKEERLSPISFGLCIRRGLSVLVSSLFLLCLPWSLGLGPPWFCSWFCLVFKTQQDKISLDKTRLGSIAKHP